METVKVTVTATGISIEMVTGMVISMVISTGISCDSAIMMEI